MKCVITFSILIILSGCAVQIKVVQPDNFSISIPQLDTKQEAELGISLVSKEVGYKYKALRILKATKIKTGYVFKEVREGELFINDSYTKSYDLYSNIDNLTYGIALPKSGGKAISFSKVKRLST